MRYLVITPWVCDCNRDPSASTDVMLADSAEEAEALSQRLVAARHGNATLGGSYAIPLSDDLRELVRDGFEYTRQAYTRQDVVNAEAEAEEAGS